jgi:ribosomal protein S18 acetylase RimI-like enzyme
VHRIIEALTGTHISMARILFEEYAASIGIDLCFQGYADELRQLPGKYSPPSGGLFIALIDDQLAGCVGLRPLESPGVAELKRLYVRPFARGQGLGLALTQHAIERARAAGYDRIRLDTLPSMQNALRLYRRLRFKDIPPYTFNPVPDVTYMELDLQAGAA